MKLKMREGVLDLSSPTVMGQLDVRSCCDPAVLKSEALEMVELGAAMVELGISMPEEGGTPGTEEEELQLIVPAVRALRPFLPVYIAVNTVYPQVMEAAVNAGADLIVDPHALRAPGAVETAARLEVPVCIIFDMHSRFTDEAGVDPTGVVSEFLYERIDACLNAGIPRSRIIIDPTVGRAAPLEMSLKMVGRLNTFKSFALPLSMNLPRFLPQQDEYVNEHLSVAVALAIFGVEAGVSIIRTPRVEDMTLALDTWQACSKSARPFRLSKAIARRFLRRKKENRAEEQEL